jgi:hypothetical protein
VTFEDRLARWTKARNEAREDDRKQKEAAKEERRVADESARMYTEELLRKGWSAIRKLRLEKLMVAVAKEMSDVYGPTRTGPRGTTPQFSLTDGELQCVIEAGQRWVRHGLTRSFTRTPPPFEVVPRVVIQVSYRLENGMLTVGQVSKPATKWTVPEVEKVILESLPNH